jgi:hypothetical protein
MDRKWFAVPERANTRRDISMHYFFSVYSERNYKWLENGFVF